MDESRNGPKRILILGKSGSGKSTLSKRLSTLLDIPHIELDTIFWNPGWVKTPDDKMRAEVDARARPDGQWIVDGNYRVVADITWQRADLVVWLDYPLYVNLWRLFWRSFWRICTQSKVCGENYESGAALFWPTIEYNVLICCIAQSKKLHEVFPNLIEEYGKEKVMIFTSQRSCDVWVETMSKKRS